MSTATNIQINRGDRTEQDILWSNAQVYVSDEEHDTETPAQVFSSEPKPRTYAEYQHLVAKHDHEEGPPPRVYLREDSEGGTLYLPFREV